jgi:hypothetical protein
VQQVQRGALARAVDGATQRLAIDRDDLAREVVGERADPTPKRAFELDGIQRVEHAPERIGAGRAVGQIEERAEPVGARLGEVFEGVPAVGATQRAAQGHHDDVVERVELGAIDARVVEDREVGQHETHAVRRSDDGFRAWATCHRGRRSRRGDDVDRSRKAIEFRTVKMRSPCPQPPQEQLTRLDAPHR